MAKYSRRGLVFNFIAYLLCLSVGQFYQENRDLTVVLTVGLLVITLLRGILLFRFYQFYPRAPQRWRNNYFFATLLGAIWWGFILVSITLKQGMHDQAPLLWLYSVVFFSTTAHAFAPYQRFLTYYQACALLPAAIAAFIVGGLTATVYGVLMVMFYVILTHQCRLMSENYWERLEASYALARKTQSIEEEKRDTRASAALNREFLGCLRADLEKLVTQTGSAINDLSGASPTGQRAIKRCEKDFQHVYANVNDFYSVLNKELQLENKIFNIRHELQNIVADYLDDAELAGITVETSLSPTLPMRLKGDASRLAQVINTLLSHCIDNMEQGVILFEVEFLREYEAAGELYINISSYSKQQKRRFFPEEGGRLPQANLSFAVARGIAELMNGSIEINEIPGEGVTYRLDAKFDIADLVGQLDFHANSFQNHSIMLVHKSIRVQDIKRRELNALGFTVVTEATYKKAQAQLAASYKEGKPIEAVLYFVEEGDTEARDFNVALVEHPELRYTHQLIAGSQRQQRLLENQGYTLNEFVHLVNKPVGLFELETAFQTVYADKDDDNDEALPAETLEDATPLAKTRVAEILLISGRSSIQEYFQQLSNDDSAFKLHLCEELDNLESLIKKLPLNSIVIDSDEHSELVPIVDGIRVVEATTDSELYLPVIAISDAASDQRIDVYELGIDDFVVVADDDKTLRRRLLHWANLSLLMEN